MWGSGRQGGWGPVGSSAELELRDPRKCYSVHVQCEVSGSEAKCSHQGEQLPVSMQAQGHLNARHPECRDLAVTQGI